MDTFQLVSIVEPTTLCTSSSDPEKQALHMFRTEVCILIASAFDHDFWTYYLLQIADAYLPIRHATAALAVAYEKSIISISSNGTSDSFVPAQYNKAIHCLYDYFRSGSRPCMLNKVVILVTTLLFTCLCAVQGLHLEACAHLRHGLALIHEWGLGMNKCRSIGQITPVPLIYLVAIFTQLDTQARIILRASEMVSRDPWVSHHVRLREHWDCNIGMGLQAFVQLEILHNQILQSTHDATAYNSASASFYQRVLSDWDTSFRTFNYYTTDFHHSSVIAVHMRRSMTGAYLALMTAERGTARNRADACYEAILDVASQMIRALGFQEGKASFCLPNGFIECLYFVAAHCKQSPIRFQAIDILRRYPIIEGVWKSATAAELAMALPPSI
jgi:hypothetical protein